jgi:hypothetical protein
LSDRVRSARSPSPSPVAPLRLRFLPQSSKGLSAVDAHRACVRGKCVSASCGKRTARVREVGLHPRRGAVVCGRPGRLVYGAAPTANPLLRRFVATGLDPVALVRLECLPGLLERRDVGEGLLESVRFTNGRGRAAAAGPPPSRSVPLECSQGIQHLGARPPLSLKTPFIAFAQGNLRHLRGADLRREEQKRCAADLKPRVKSSGSRGAGTPHIHSGGTQTSHLPQVVAHS